MKWIIYSLLLVNIGIAVWHWNKPLLNSPLDEVTDYDSDIPRLILLSEKNAPKTSVSGERRCYSLGPFNTKADGVATRSVLAKNNIKASLRKNRDQVNEGYWVMLPPAASRDEANKTVNLLREKGEKEFFLVVSGDQVNAISLGVFAKSESAQRRLAQVQKLGFEPTVQGVELPVTRYWLDWPVSKGVLDKKLLDRLRKNASEIGLSERGCGAS